MAVENSAMLHKLVFLLALLFGLSAAPISALRPQLSFHLRHGQKISKLSGDALIQAACQGIGDNETECISTLQSAPPQQKADANGLAFFTLRFVENHAENITAGIKKIAAVPDVAPLLQSALTDCMDQYSSLDDMIENAINAVQANAHSDAQQFIIAAISGVDLCDSQLQGIDMEEKAENITEDVDLEKGLKKYNAFHKNLLSAALNILTVD